MKDAVQDAVQHLIIVYPRHTHIHTHTHKRVHHYIVYLSTHNASPTKVCTHLTRLAVRGGHAPEKQS